MKAGVDIMFISFSRPYYFWQLADVHRHTRDQDKWFAAFSIVLDPRSSLANPDTQVAFL